MSTLHSMLTPVTGDICGNETEVYRDGDVREHATEVHMLGKHGQQMLAVRVEDYGFKVSFALLEFYSSDGNGVDTTWECIAHGEGFAESLRELRHTWWGEPDNAGYMFYPPMLAIAEAMAILRKWFD